MPSCCIKQCGARKNKNQPELTIHRFPVNKILKEKWLSVIGTENINPRHKMWHVCSKHFEESCFNRTLDVTRLHDNAVPSSSLIECYDVLSTSKAKSHKTVNDNLPLTLPPPVQNIVRSHKAVNDNVSVPLPPSLQNIDFASKASSSSTHENLSIQSDDSDDTTKRNPEKNESSFKRRALKDFDVEANLKTSRKLHSGKRIKTLQQDMGRQERKINDMKSHINVVQDYSHSESDRSENGDGDGEKLIFIERCKCCLNEGDLKNMWTPCKFEGETEIYGMMLTECFALSWQQPEDNMKYMDMICTSCIARLRDALAFKREVLVSEEVLREKQDELFRYTTVNEGNYLKEEEEEEEETEFKEVEYLEITDSLNKDESLSDERWPSSDNSLLVERKRKLSKKLSKEERNKTYKRYTAEELQMAIDAVQNNGMSHSEAAECFDVPRRTISAKIHNIINKQEEQSQSPEENRKIKWPKKLPNKDRNKKYKLYTKKAMRMAIDAVREKGMSRSKASEMFKVPKKTLGTRLRLQNITVKNEEPDDDDACKRPRKTLQIHRGN